MEKLYRETKGSLMQINDLLGKLDRAFDVGEIDAIKLEVNKKLNETINAFDQLDLYVVKEPATKRYDAKIKVDQLKYDLNHFRAAFNTISNKKDQKRLEEKRREELLRTTFNVNKSNDSVLNLEYDQNELRHHNRLAKSNDEVDRMIQHGENVLENLKGQSSMLKEVKRKMLNVTNTLGLSNTLIRMIDRRNISDRYILFGGMIITCIVMFLTIKYLI